MVLHFTKIVARVLAMKTVPLFLVMLLMMSLTDTLGVEMSDSHVKHSKVPKIGRTTTGLPF